ncbi:beta-1,3-galactosyltransferase 6-like isoform X2 [Eurytemora carolleeae]|uniref:beta-1,3-galactosyltransferase 6-like isoform X2 n=1 Tax=Eurytemora carolleeae TaxID=1294199 RepID=UPI000C786636|nr:beta-1,3-galactosyltransferase 6-like isoform X2 [Eurytemora carolleeae]|eukprot:XP_023326596.1 beta-1,3-galactosyltransferase 6-like isoform X2 [Eurytemora affinis]
MRRVSLQRIVVPVFTFFCGILFSSLFNQNQISESSSVSEIKHESLRGEEEGNVDLLILIVSAPFNTEKRAAVRETWLSHRNMRGFFVVGIQGLSRTELKDLEAEKVEYEDLIFLDMKEEYSSLADKVLRMFEVAAESYEFDFVMKVDDDTFINPYLLDNELKKPMYKNPLLYWGFFDGRAPVLKQGKWAEVSYDLCDRYIPYALGGGYGLGWRLVKHIARSADMLKLYKNEDVSVGTWLAGVQVTRVHDERFDTEWQSRGCLNNFLVMQNRNPDEMRELWSRISGGKQLCKQEKVVRKSYAYNWELPPSQCCVR